MQRIRQLWPRLRRGAALLCFAALCILGYRRGFDAHEDLHIGQTPVVVRHKIDDLMGPDFSASGMSATVDSLITLANSVRLQDSHRVVTFYASRASSSSSHLEVTTFPYIQKAVERLLNEIRKPSRS